MVALVFDFINGFHDAANSIATVVSTRVLSPRCAVLWAAFFNFIAFLFFGLHVANTIGKGIIDPDVVDPAVVFAALVGAIVWNLITWWYGIPSSSSHALIGGLAGAGCRQGRRRRRSTRPASPRSRCPSCSSPLIGLVLGVPPDDGRLLDLPALDAGAVDALVPARAAASRRRSTPSATAATTRRRPWASSRCCSSRPATSATTFHVPLWVVLACHAAMALGTLSGGWRIVQTMGMKITKLKPVGGFCAETGGAITLFAATAPRHPGLDHAHHHRRDRRRRRRRPSSRRCAGASPGASSGPGSSRSRARRSSPALTWSCSQALYLNARRETAWPSPASSRRCYNCRAIRYFTNDPVPDDLIAQGARRRDPRAERVEPPELALHRGDGPGDQEDAPGVLQAIVRRVRVDDGARARRARA